MVEFSTGGQTDRQTGGQTAGDDSMSLLLLPDWGNYFWSILINRPVKVKWSRHSMRVPAACWLERNPVQDWNWHRCLVKQELNSQESSVPGETDFTVCFLSVALVHCILNKPSSTFSKQLVHSSKPFIQTVPHNGLPVKACNLLKSLCLKSKSLCQWICQCHRNASPFVIFCNQHSQNIQSWCQYRMISWKCSLYFQMCFLLYLFHSQPLL